jgi:zinc protease
MCLLLLATLGVAPAARAAAPAAPRTLTLANGMRVVLAPDARDGMVDVSVWYATGARYERSGSIGISHLFERLSSYGAVPGGTAEIRRTIEATGGNSTSYTGPDFTCYTHTVPRDAVDLALRLEAGRFALKPTAVMLDTERAIIRDELRVSAHTNPLERGMQRIYATAMPSHPYRWPVLGSDADLQRITVKQCEEFEKTRYAPDQALVVMVGNFDPDQATESLKRAFEPIRRRGRIEKPAIPADQTRQLRAYDTVDVQVTVIMVGWRVPAAAATDGPALDLISTLLTRGASARLGRRRTAEDTIGLFAQTGRDQRRETNLFWAASAARSAADSTAIEHWLVGEVERMATEPVSGEDLDRARRQLSLALLMQRQTTRDRGQALGTSAMAGGDWGEADRHLKRLESLTPADLQAAAARTLVAAHRTVVWIMPGGGQP